MRIKDQAQILEALNHLIIFRELTRTAPGRALRELLEAEPGAQTKAAWCRLEAVRLQTAHAPPDYPSLLEQLVVEQVNPVTLAWERGEQAALPFALLEHEMEQLRLLASLPDRLQEYGNLPLLIPAKPTVFSRSRNTTELAEQFAGLIRNSGCGIFQYHRMVSWQPAKKAALSGALTPDPVQLADLWGYQHARETIIGNIRRLLAGGPAHNMLLYGARGSGKSATIKALVNGFYGRGLRLIEADSSNTAALPDLLEQLQPRGLKFIILLDDLSFDNDNRVFRHLKSILEGGVSTRPVNTVICVTTNRRRLVRQSFKERQMDDEVHEQDTMEEQLALSDRFGLTVTFAAPDQTEYLEIVRHLLKRRGIEYNPEQLEERALRWERSGHGRSGRTARQFADQLSGELRLAAEENGISS